MKLKQEKRRLGGFQKRTHTDAHTRLNTLFSDKSNEHIKPLSYKTPTYMIHWQLLPCFSGGSVVTCSFDTWHLPFLPSTCLLNLTGSLKACVSCVLIISTPFVKKNKMCIFEKRTWGGKLKPHAASSLWRKFPAPVGEPDTPGVLELTLININFQTYCKCQCKHLQLTMHPCFLTPLWGFCIFIITSTIEDWRDD